MKKIKYIEIDIGKDFSVNTGGRYKADSDFSGQLFYEKLLKPKFEQAWKDKNLKVSINFDNTIGYTSAFIAEVFTELTKDFKKKDEILKKIKLISKDDPSIIKDIKEIIAETDV